MTFDLRQTARIGRGPHQGHPSIRPPYITARCNLACEQCNIIYANSDVRECTIDEVRRIAKIGRNRRRHHPPDGREPFIHKDLPDIVRAFEGAGIHVRSQTNALAKE